MTARCKSFYAKLCRVCLLPDGVINVKSLIEDQVEESEVSRSFSKVKVDINGNESDYNEMVCQKDSARLCAALSLIERITEAEKYYFRAQRDGSSIRILNDELNFGFNVCRACLSPEPVVRLITLNDDNMNMIQKLRMKASFNWINSEAVSMCEMCLDDVKAACDVIMDVKFSENIYYEARNDEDRIATLVHGGSKFEGQVKPRKPKVLESMRAESNQNGVESCGFKCAVCDKIFSSKGNLKQHLDSVHAKIKRFSCGSCPKMFYYHQELREHVDRNHKKKRRIFDSSRPFRCNKQGCSRFFSKSIELIRHQRSHLDVRAFVCWCSKAFKFKGQLKSHQQRHYLKKLKTGFKSVEALGETANVIAYPCPICGKVLTAKNTLLCHMKNIHKNFSCDLCQKEFNNKDGIKAHIINVHVRKRKRLSEKTAKCKS